MIGKLVEFAMDVRARQRIAIALAAGQAGRAARTLDLTDPASWEFSGFSQNGEDGIVEVLLGQLEESSRYVIEIGAADGIQNNSAWLLMTRNYDGLLVDGNPALVRRARRTVAGAGIATQVVEQFVEPDNVGALVDRALDKCPDLLSLDIDGNDLYVADALLGAGLRPRIWAVEYNSAYGPERSVTIPYQRGFDYQRAHPTQLYYGVSVAGWRTFFARHGYRFVTVDRNGINAFFADPGQFDSGFLDAVRGRDFAENRYQRMKFGGPHQAQYALIADRTFAPIEAA